ncbi:hypothetical protein V7112_15715 [Bacillus sp. JJ1566]|uniref:hypothetical protein n=1 Tax=Bacillus sp. JJ1566 TaxID=3122961 RepID=UPI002FFF368A
MNDHLENQLRSMPTANLGFENKKRIHQTLMNYEEHPVQRTLKNMKWVLPTIGGLVVVALLAFFIWTLPQNPFSHQAFLGEEQLSEIKEIEDVERTIILPTYAPFEVHEISFYQDYLGPKDFGNGKDEPSPRDPIETKFYNQNFIYLSKEDPVKMMQVTLSDSSFVPLENISSYDKDDLIKFGEGKVGSYYFNGTSQMFYWEEMGLTIMLHVTVDTKTTYLRTGPVPKEEIIKIAESFRVYKK